MPAMQTSEKIAIVKLTGSTVLQLLFQTANSFMEITSILRTDREKTGGSFKSFL